MIKLANFFAPCKVIQNSIRFWIPRCGFQIPGAGFRTPSQISFLTFLLNKDQIEEKFKRKYNFYDSLSMSQINRRLY